MKLLQENSGFSPFAVVLETRDAAQVFWDMIGRVKKTTETDAEYGMAKTISSWLMNEANFQLTPPIRFILCSDSQSSRHSVSQNNWLALTGLSHQWQ